jgi:hypothetical protein
VSHRDAVASGEARAAEAFEAFLASPPSDDATEAERGLYEWLAERLRARGYGKGT